MFILVPRADDGTLMSSGPATTHVERAYVRLLTALVSVFPGVRIDCTHVEIGTFVTVPGPETLVQIGVRLGCAIFRPYAAVWTDDPVGFAAAKDVGTRIALLKQSLETLAAEVVKEFPDVRIFKQVPFAHMLALAVPEADHAALARRIADRFGCDITDQSGVAFSTLQLP